MSPASSTGTAKPSAPSAVVQRALTYAMRPLIRLMLANGITFPALSEILKSLYVDVAEREFTITGKAQTDSRISLLSGVHRKDVKRLRAAPAVEDEAETDISLSAQIIAAWVGGPDFTDKRKHPLPLPRLARDAIGGASFESLVESVSKDIRSRAVLDEWLRLGIVEIDPDDRVKLNQDKAFVSDKGLVDKAFYLGHNLHDHAAAAVHNITGGAPAFLERSVQYDALSASSVAELAALAEKTGMEAVFAVNRQSIKLERRDKQRGAPSKRMTFGIYFYSEDAPNDAPSASGKE
jgi:hypothetical protein